MRNATLNKFVPLILLLYALAGHFQANSQVIVSLQLPQSGVTLKSQLWSMSLTNTGNDEPFVQVELLLSDFATNQPILSGSSKTFRLTKGARLLQVAELSPIVYNVLNSTYDVDPNPNGFLPIGTYLACFRVVKLVSDQTEQLAEECEMVDVEPVSPPMLQMPFDEESTEATRPYFAWIPPLPQQLFHNLLYDFVLVEVTSPQASSDAIQQNIPIYRGSNLPQIGLQYPAGLPELDSTKLYAWQVTAKGGFNAIAKSEIWTFRVKTPTQDTSAIIHKGNFYARLKRDVDVAYVICKGVLHFEYVNESNDSTVTFLISDLNSPLRQTVSLDLETLSVGFGQNFLDLDLQEISGMRQGRMYLFEIRNSRGERRFLKFQYKKSEQ